MMSRFGYDNNFNNIHIDACWLSRRGELDEAQKILQKKYPDYTDQQIEEAIKSGVTLNNALWDLSFDHWGKKIDKKTFVKGILEICSELTKDMIEHLYDNAMYDSK